MSFSAWLVLLSIMLSRYAHFVAGVRIPFLFMNENVPIWSYCILFIHSSVDGHLGYFHFLTIVNNATVNIGIQISF